MTKKYIEIHANAEVIRKRPEMYVGPISSTSFTNIIMEALCLSRSRAVEGLVSEISIKVLNDNQVSISDNGPGITMDRKSSNDKTLLENLLSESHAYKNVKHEAMKELCDNGIVVANALSKYFTAINVYKNVSYIYKYEKGVLLERPYMSGTSNVNKLVFNFQFDPEIFGSLQIDTQELIAALNKIKSFTPARINLIFDN